MTYFNDDHPNDNISQIVRFCANKAVENNLSNFSSFGDLYMQKLLQDETFHTVGENVLQFLLPELVLKLHER